MPAGIILADDAIVKNICNDNTLPETYESASSNDFLEALRIVIKYILTEKRKQKKKLKNRRGSRFF